MKCRSEGCVYCWDRSRFFEVVPGGRHSRKVEGILGQSFRGFERTTITLSGSVCGNRRVCVNGVGMVLLGCWLG